MAVEMSLHQFSICQEANGHFCNVIIPFQALANPPSCITALYTKNTCSILGRCALQISISTCTQCVDINYTTFHHNHNHHVHLARRDIKICYITETNSHLGTGPSLQCYNAQLPFTHHYENSALEFKISLDIANLNMINILSLDFHIWQDLEEHQNESQLKHLASIPSVPVDQLYRHMVNGIQHITPFTSPEESTGDTDSIWTLFSHTGVYVMAIGLLIPAGLGIFCCYFLMLTCQISMPTFTTRYHTIYNCG